jgi:hypothetical protein
MTVNDIKTAASQYKNQYRVIAVRTQDTPFILGETEFKSQRYTDGSRTYQLNGLSATNVNSRNPLAIRMHTDEYSVKTGRYYGEYVAIVGGNEYHYGTDAGEVIISDPVVIQILK